MKGADDMAIAVGHIPLDETATPTGTVVAVQVCPGHREPMRPLAVVTATAGRGLTGDAHNRARGTRQVLLQDSETLERFALPVGAIKENITTRGVPINRLPPGTRLHIGPTVILELTGVCEPCHRMDEIRPGLQAALAQQRGMLARVVVGGEIQPGAAIRVALPDA
jgi:hypothetical protein